MTVVYSEASKRHLLAIGQYVRDNFGAAALRKLRQRVADFASRIQVDPEF
jgi:plasmid stabilization system protein ParE